LKSLGYINADNTQLQRVFVAQMPGELDSVNHRNTIVYAESGHVKDENNGEQKLVLNQGRRYQGQVDQPNYEIVEFGQYEIQSTVES
jgi:lipopolysaccharide export system permease protein